MLYNANLINKSLQNTIPVSWNPAIYEGVFSDIEIKRIQKQMEKSEFMPAMTEGDQALFGSADEDSMRQALQSHIPLTDDFLWLYSKMEDLAIQANFNQNWNFDMWGMMEQAIYLKYHEDMKGHYEFHIDIGAEGPSLHRKISCSVILNDDYEGGELQFNGGNENNDCPKVSPPKGSIVIFPSFVRHSVRPVTKGERHAIVLWLHGKPFS